MSFRSLVVMFVIMPVLYNNNFANNVITRTYVYYVIHPMGIVSDINI